MQISLIAAIGKNRELGKDNRLLWDIPEDMKFFRETTKGHPVIMGRKTFESIGKPLPNRLNVIVTRNADYKQEGAVVVTSLEEAIDVAGKNEVEGSEEIFVIGGAQIYEQALEFADKLYLTIVDAEFEADTFFPDFSAFQCVEKRESSNEDFSYSFQEFESV